MSTERVDTGTAALAVDSGDVPVQVSGIAIGEGDVTIGGSGKETYWPPETLEEAAEGLEGQPIATSQNHTADGAKAMTPSEAVIGEVTEAAYQPGTGVVFKGEVDDPDIARSIENGRLEVSPLVARDTEPLQDGPAEFKATEIHRWRDLAVVVDGAAPSNQITVGDSAVTAEALAAQVESLQDGPSLSESVSVPERVQIAAQAALDADEEGLIPDSCGTGTGTSRAEALADNDVQVNDFLTRGEDDKTPIPSYLNSHEEDATTEQPPTEWSEDEWESCGNAGLARWGWYVDWFRGKANELSEQRGEEQPYESMSTHEALQLDEPRTPTFDGTETSEEQPWGEVSKDLADVVDALGLADVETTSDLTEEQKQAIAEHTLLGDPDADSFGELFFFPVVNYTNGNLNEGALNAVRGGRGAQADIADEVYEMAEDMAAELLAENFEGYEMSDGELETGDTESMADVDDVSEGTLVRWNSAGDRDAFGMVEEVRTEGDEPLDDEIDGDQTINPPAALITVHTPGDDGWEETETQVGHTLNTDTLEVIDELPNPESLAKHLENMADTPEEFVFDNPGEAMSKAQEMGFEEIHTHGEGEETIFMPAPTHSELMDWIDENRDMDLESMATVYQPAKDDDPSRASTLVAALSETTNMDDDTINAVVAAAEELDDPQEAVESLAAKDDPRVVEAQEAEALADVREYMEEALAEQTGLSEETVAAMPFEALHAEFADDEGNLDTESLSQTPETRQPDGTEALGADADMAKAESLMNDYETFGTESLKEDITDALGVDDWDTATEVLE